MSHLERAVEILARLAASNARRALESRPPLDRPVVLANERIALALGTPRDDVERAFGVGFAYPIRGWHTYAAREDGARRFLSLFYSDGRLLALEYYLPKADRIPTLAARDYGTFRLDPGDVAIGAATARLDESYAPVAGGPAPIVYAEAYDARFAGGIAYVMGNEGRVERLGIYAAA